MLDGEVCALDDQGRSSFSSCSRVSGASSTTSSTCSRSTGEPALDRPLTERREILAELLDRRSRTVRLSETFDDGEALLEAAEAQGLEGVMAKRASSAYEQRRSRNWVKVKVRPEQEFVVVGYTKGQGRRARLGALVWR